MPRHWLLLVLVLLGTVAHARTPVRLPPAMTATIEPGIHAGRLVLAFADPEHTLDYDELRLEFTSAAGTHALTFSHGTYTGPIDLDPFTQHLPRGEHGVVVTWRSPALRAVTHATTMAPYHCGLSAGVIEPPPPPETSPRPYALGLAIAALLVGLALAKRAGTGGTHVPCSAP